MIWRITNDEWPQYRWQNLNSPQTICLVSSLSQLKRNFMASVVPKASMWYSGVIRNLKCRRQKLRSCCLDNLETRSWTWGTCHQRSQVQILLLGKKTKTDIIKTNRYLHRLYFGGKCILDCCSTCWQSVKKWLIPPLIVLWDWRCHHI